MRITTGGGRSTHGLASNTLPGSTCFILAGNPTVVAGRRGGNHRDTETQRRKEKESLKKEEQLREQTGERLTAFFFSSCLLCVSVSLWFISSSLLPFFPSS